MIRKRTKIIIDLTGPQGNAFCLSGVAHKLCEQLNKDWKPIRNRMVAGDYENLIQEMDKEFGDFIILER